MTTTQPQTELQLQASCFQWAHNHHPQTRKLLFHVPNGGSRNRIEGMQLKASGVVPGIPDLLFLWKGRLHAFELKTEQGVLSREQKEVHIRWLEHYVQVHVVRSFDQFKKIFTAIVAS